MAIVLGTQKIKVYDVWKHESALIFMFWKRNDSKTMNNTKHNNSIVKMYILSDNFSLDSQNEV
jgi:hypothetical protein